MLPGLLEKKIGNSSETVQWAFVIIACAFAAVWLVFEYRTRKLQNLWYAMNIEQIEKGSNINASTAIKEALRDDFTSKLMGQK